MGQQGFVHRFGALYRLALVDDGSPISLELVGETGIDGRIVSMGYGKDEQIYAAEYNFPPRLWAIDPETAEAELIGELSHIPAGDMTFDEEGRLWIFGILGTLFLVDTQTATMSEVATVVETVWGLAYFEGQLHSLIPTSTVEEWSLVSIDPGTGDMTPIAVISGFDPGPITIDFPTQMEFDRLGRLWMGVAIGDVVINPPDLRHAIYHVRDPFGGTVSSRSAITPTIWPGGFALAKAAPTIVEVPTVGLPGILALAIGLGLAALVVLRRRTERCPSLENRNRHLSLPKADP